MSRARTRGVGGLRRRAALLGLCLLSALVGSTFVGVTLRGHEVTRDAAALSAEIAMYEAERANLEREVAARKTDSYVEQKARELGYVRPGEGMATVRDPGQAGTTAGGPAEAALLERLGRWLTLFFRP